MKVTKFGTVSIPGEDQELSYGVQARDNLVVLPNGSFDVDGGELVLQPTTLSLRFIVAEDDVDATLDAIYKEASKGRRLLKAVQRNGYEYRQTWVKLVSMQRDRRPGLYGYQPIVMTLRQDYPYWLASADEPVYLDDGYELDSGWDFDAGHIEEQSITTTSHNFTITNDGGAVVPRGWIKLVPETGANIVNPKIYNAANGMWMKLTDTLTAAEELLIELLPRTVEVDGSGVYDDFSIGDDQAAFMHLELGDNAITVTCDSITGTVKMYWQWSRHYL